MTRPAAAKEDVIELLDSSSDEEKEETTSRHASREKTNKGGKEPEVINLLNDDEDDVVSPRRQNKRKRKRISDVIPLVQTNPRKSLRRQRTRKATAQKAPQESVIVIDLSPENSDLDGADEEEEDYQGMLNSDPVFASPSSTPAKKHKCRRSSAGFKTLDHFLKKKQTTSQNASPKTRDKLSTGISPDTQQGTDQLKLPVQANQVSEGAAAVTTRSQYKRVKTAPTHPISVTNTNPSATSKDPSMEQPSNSETSREKRQSGHPSANITETQDAIPSKPPTKQQSSNKESSPSKTHPTKNGQNPSESTKSPRQPSATGKNAPPLRNQQQTSTNPSNQPVVDQREASRMCLQGVEDLAKHNVQIWKRTSPNAADAPVKSGGEEQGSDSSSTFHSTTSPNRPDAQEGCDTSFQTCLSEDSQDTVLYPPLPRMVQGAGEKRDVGEKNDNGEGGLGSERNEKREGCDTNDAEKDETLQANTDGTMQSRVVLKDTKEVASAITGNGEIGVAECKPNRSLERQQCKTVPTSSTSTTKNQEGGSNHHVSQPLCNSSTMQLDLLSKNMTKVASPMSEEGAAPTSGQFEKTSSQTINLVLVLSKPAGLPWGVDVTLVEAKRVILEHTKSMTPFYVDRTKDFEVDGSTITPTRKGNANSGSLETQGVCDGDCLSLIQGIGSRGGFKEVVALPEDADLEATKQFVSKALEVFRSWNVVRLTVSRTVMSENTGRKDCQQSTNVTFLAKGRTSVPWNGPCIGFTLTRPSKDVLWDVELQLLDSGEVVVIAGEKSQGSQTQAQANEESTREWSTLHDGDVVLAVCNTDKGGCSGAHALRKGHLSMTGVLQEGVAWLGSVLQVFRESTRVEVEIRRRGVEVQLTRPSLEAKWGIIMESVRGGCVSASHESQKGDCNGTTGSLLEDDLIVAVGLGKQDKPPGLLVSEQLHWCNATIAYPLGEVNEESMNEWHETVHGLFRMHTFLHLVIVPRSPREIQGRIVNDSSVAVPQDVTKLSCGKRTSNQIALQCEGTEPNSPGVLGNSACHEGTDLQQSAVSDSNSMHLPENSTLERTDDVAVCNASEVESDISSSRDKQESSSRYSSCVGPKYPILIQTLIRPLHGHPWDFSVKELESGDVIFDDVKPVKWWPMKDSDDWSRPNNGDKILGLSSITDIKGLHRRKPWIKYATNAGKEMGQDGPWIESVKSVLLDSSAVEVEIDRKPVELQMRRDSLTVSWGISLYPVKGSVHAQTKREGEQHNTSKLDGDIIVSIGAETNENSEHNADFSLPSCGASFVYGSAPDDKDEHTSWFENVVQTFRGHTRLKVRVIPRRVKSSDEESENVAFIPQATRVEHQIERQSFEVKREVLKRHKRKSFEDLEVMNEVSSLCRTTVPPSGGLPQKRLCVMNPNKEKLYDFKIDLRPSNIPNAGHGAFLTYLGSRKLKDIPAAISERTLPEIDFFPKENRFDAIMPPDDDGLVYSASVSVSGEGLFGEYINGTEYCLKTRCPLPALFSDGTTMNVKLSGTNLHYPILGLKQEENNHTLKQKKFDGLGFLRCFSESDYTDDDEEFCSYNSGCGLINIGRYGPFLKDDRKPYFLFAVKNFIFGNEPAGWSFDVPEKLGEYDQTIDITGDATGEPHQLAKTHVLMYINEVGHNKNLVQNVKSLESDDRVVEYYLHVEEQMKKGQTVELLVDYHKEYEGVRERKGYGKANLFHDVPCDSHEHSRVLRNISNREEVGNCISDLSIKELSTCVQFVTSKISVPVSAILDSLLKKSKSKDVLEKSQIDRQWVARIRMHWLSSFIISHIENLKGRASRPETDLMRKVKEKAKKLAWHSLRDDLRSCREIVFAQKRKSGQKETRSALSIILEDVAEELLFAARRHLHFPFDESEWCPLSVKLLKDALSEIASYRVWSDKNVKNQRKLMERLLTLSRQAKEYIDHACSSTAAVRGNLLEYFREDRQSEAVVGSLLFRSNHKENLACFDKQWNELLQFVFKESKTAIYSCQLKSYSLRKAVEADLAEAQLYQDALELCSLVTPMETNIKETKQGVYYIMVKHKFGPTLSSQGLSLCDERTLARRADAINGNGSGLSVDRTWYLVNQVIAVIHALATTCVHWEECNDGLARVSNIPRSVYSLEKLCDHLNVSLDDARVLLSKKKCTISSQLRRLRSLTSVVKESKSNQKKSASSHAQLGKKKGVRVSPRTIKENNGG